MAHTSIAVLVEARPNEKGPWNLVSFDELTSEAERTKTIIKAKNAASFWESVLNRHTIVAEIQADRCQAVNNHDGFPDARSIF